jgi:CubicO group peptidase (beta-lactamase class C family)
MRRTSFRPGETRTGDIVPTEIDAWRGREIRGEVHDESAWKLRDRMVAGSAGLFSTVKDLIRFLAMLLGGGEWAGRRYVSPAMIDAMTTNQIAHLGACTGLGWELAQPRFMGERCSPRCIGKTGFTGCSVVCDIDYGIGIVLLANHTWPRRRADRQAIDEVRRGSADIVLRALRELEIARIKNSRVLF